MCVETTYLPTSTLQMKNLNLCFLCLACLYKVTETLQIVKYRTGHSDNVSQLIITCISVAHGITLFSQTLVKYISMFLPDNSVCRRPFRYRN